MTKVVLLFFLMNFFFPQIAQKKGADNRRSVVEIHLSNLIFVKFLMALQKIICTNSHLLLDRPAIASNIISS